MKNAFMYALCNKPASLFDVNGLFISGNTSVLAKILLLELDVADPSLIRRDVQYVLDGGAMLYQVIWPNTVT